MDERILPSPPASPESVAFYEEAAEGRFIICRCTQCGKAHWYPRSLCPFCFGPTAWEPVGGRGRIYSFSVMRRVTPPYALAYVTLDEGPTMMTNLVDCDFDGARIDQPVTLVFKLSEGGVPVPCFSTRSDCDKSRIHQV